MSLKSRANLCPFLHFNSSPEIIGLRSYGAMNDLSSREKQGTRRWANDWVGNSDRPFDDAIG